MKNLDKYLTLLDGDVDGLLLTSRYSRHVRRGVRHRRGRCHRHKEGLPLLHRQPLHRGPPQKNLKGFEVLEVDRDDRLHPCAWNAAIADFGVDTLLALKSDYLTAAGVLTAMPQSLPAKLVPLPASRINAFRASKEDWELELYAQGAGDHRQSLRRGHAPASSPA